MEIKNEAKRNKKEYFFRRPTGVFALVGCLFICALCSLAFGSVAMSVPELFKAVFRLGGNATNEVILYSVRLPRIIACILAGVGLSVSGVLLQTVTDNALASPGLVGVNQGAGLFVVLILSVAPSAAYAMPLAAFLGALFASALILTVSRAMGDSRSSFILSGIALGALISAFISFFTIIDDDVLSSYNAFSIGSCAGATLNELIFPAVMIALSLALSLALSSRINVLALGELSASSLGVKTKRVRLIAVICASASAAAVVSFAGLLGFVGLIVPNFTRKLVGNNTKFLLIDSSLIGASLVLLADMLGRVVAAPSEIPVGITMACIGAPFFLGVLLQRKNRGELR